MPARAYNVYEMKLTRRELAGAVAAGAAALGQAAAKQAAAPADARKQAEARIRGDGQALANYQVDMAVEPASAFKA